MDDHCGKDKDNVQMSKCADVQMILKQQSPALFFINYKLGIFVLYATH
jgi:hypothetical protein